MEFRRILLRIMLISLGMAALVGAMAMLFFRADVIWRVVATTILTALGSGLMLLCSLLLASKSSRLSAYLGIATIGVEFLIMLVLIWMPGGFRGISEELFGTSGAVAATALPAMAALRLAEAQGARRAGRSGVGIAGAVLLMLLGAIWGLGPPQNFKLFASANALGWIGILAVVSLVGERQALLPLRVAGTATATVAWLIALVGIWQNSSEYGALTTAISTAVVLALANLIALCPLKSGQTWLRAGTLVCASATALCIDWIALSGTRADWDLLARAAGAFSILSACGCLAMVVLFRLNRRLDLDLVATEIRQCTLYCPMCQTKQTLAAGDARCGKCGLRIHTRFDEPRCHECGYLLYLLTSDRCPECGTLVTGGQAQAMRS